MVERLKQFLAPPTFANEEQNRIAGILNTILLTLLAAGIVMTLIRAVFRDEETAITLFVASLVTLVCYGLMRLTVSTISAEALGNVISATGDVIHNVETDWPDAIMDPVTITMPYDPGLLPPGVSETDLYASFHNGLDWIAMPSRVDTVRNQVVVTTTHFSWWEIGNLCKPFGDSFSVEDQVAYDQAREYFRILADHRDFFDTVTTSDGEVLFNVHAEQALWLGKQRSCDLDDYTRADILQELGIDAEPIEIAQTMIAMGKILQAQEVDSLQIL